MEIWFIFFRYFRELVIFSDHPEFLYSNWISFSIEYKAAFTNTNLNVNYVIQYASKVSNTKLITASMRNTHINVITDIVQNDQSHLQGVRQ